MSLRTTTRTLLSSAPTRTRTAAALLRPPPSTALSLTRQQAYHPTPPLSAYKDDQDRQSLKPRTSEGTRSGTDDEVAHSDTAFNRNKTAPADEKAAAATNGNPLEASGANQEFSRSQNESEAPADKSGKKVKSSVHGGKKSGKVGPMP